MTILSNLRGPVPGELAIASAFAIAAYARAWTRATERDVTQLDQLANAETASVRQLFSPNDIAGLPPPVARYFEFALTPGQPRVRHVVIRHAGEFQAEAS